MTDTIYIDVETIPDQSPGAKEAAIERIKAPSHYGEEAAKKYRDKKGLTAWESTSLQPMYGEIVTVCYTGASGEVTGVQRDPRDLSRSSEAEILGLLWHSLRDYRACPHFVGWQLGFDLRFLWMRSMICGVRPPWHIPWRAKPWQGLYTDLLYEWAGGELEGYKLQTVAKVLGIEMDDTIDGSQVWACVQAGRMDTVVQHCRSDVLTCWAIHARLDWREVEEQTEMTL